ncbi:response regulator [Aquincola sp. S2]|uniref:histidine kinase n=1 Tax=Pseudaquabacterium terrae TaxID=2732868 RepID=A0ABX2ETQ9_9BURK|nr:ATP-binding protein [Aquabacterium terrae]NRF71875.1 response regulator [Aquabacterium terrae]
MSGQERSSWEPEAGRARLLIVDDEPIQLQALCGALEGRDFDIVGVGSAGEALAQLRRGGCDMLLTDQMMPGTDGIALTRAALELDPLLAVVLMTADGTIGSAVEAMQAGACDYVLKPFHLDTVLPVIERGLAMRRLRQENAALEQRVRRHVAELEASNRELDAFTRSASHDLRSPLNAVLGFAMLLRKHAGARLADDHLQWLGDIERSARRMNRLIDDLMRLSHLGRKALDLQPVDLAPLVQDVLDDLRRPQPDHPAQIVCDALPIIEADAALLRQVYVNLLSNALKFTRHTPRPRIEIGSEKQDGRSVFYVRDNGPGFDMAQAAQLFQAFQRLHRQDEFEGSGVGLSIVERVVQRHGGRVWADATPGAGASFYFTLGDAVR